MDNLTSNVVEQIARKVEPLTRYDRSSLQVSAGATRLATGIVRTHFSARISNTHAGGAGHLPYVQAQLSSEEELRRAAGDTEALGNRELPARLESWARAHAQSDRDLSESDCFQGPKTFGFEWICSRCSGQGKVKCPEPTCELGKIKCAPCDGRGQVKCDKCERWIRVWREGNIQCPAGCKAGKTSDGSRCGTCNGKGWITCPKCGGNRMIQHSGCGGRGWNPCGKCDATGFVRCSPCEGRGYFHSMRTVACSVVRDYKVVMANERNGEVQSKLSNSQLSELRSWGTAQQRPVKTDASSALREYDLACLVTEVTIKVGTKSLHFTGFGNKAALYNYQSVASELLAGDFAALKVVVENAPSRLDTKQQEELTRALKNFLASEVNIDIHDEQKKNAHLREGIVSQGYVDEALSLIRRALWRLYFSEMGLSSIAATATLPTLAFVAAGFTNVLPILNGWAIPLIGGFGVIPQFLFEQRALNRLIAKLSPEDGDRLRLLLSRHHVPWKFRAIALGVAILFGGTAAVLFEQLM